MIPWWPDFAIFLAVEFSVSVLVGLLVARISR